MSTNATASVVELYEISTILKSTYAHYIIYGSTLLGFLWGLYNMWIVSYSLPAKLFIQSILNSNYNGQTYHMLLRS